MLECNLVERTSKDGNNYFCLEIDFGNGYKKLVFLNPAEKALLGVNNK